jgi:SAM-dependent methyltransferase
MTKGHLFPSIWLVDFFDKQGFDRRASELASLFGVLDGIDDKVLQSRHPFSVKAYCAVCREVTSLNISWHYGGVGEGGAVHPAWTETAVCEKCGLNSRMRALVDFLINKVGNLHDKRVYAAEQITPAFKVFKRLFKHLVGSEYLGPDYKPGQKGGGLNNHFFVRHEDLSRLSFPDAGFDLAITQDVFEHIADYRKVFSEIVRVLVPGGKLVFTIPFFHDLEQTLVRAGIKEDGSIQHYYPGEYHGNPVSSEGSLCFQHFGWDILSVLKEEGFSESFASLYWGPWQGHLGIPFFVFCAVK